MNGQLDWLARNMPSWEGYHDYVAYVYENKAKRVSKHSPRPSGCDAFTRQQWLDRRAELQNKPSWGDAPEWAQWMAQDECGMWYWYADEPATERRVFDSESVSSRAAKGEVLGDWRDTLEKRLSEQAVTARLQEATDNVLAAVPELKSDRYEFEPLTREQALQWQWTVDNVETWHHAPLGHWPSCAGWSWEQARGSVYLMRAGQRCIGEAQWYEACEYSELNTKTPSGFQPFTSVEDAQPELREAQLGGGATALRTIHHAAFLHQGCQLLLSEPELVVFRTADGELIHCKPKECLIDPDVYGLAARLLADMSGHPVAPEHMRELVEQMGWAV